MSRASAGCGATWMRSEPNRRAMTEQKQPLHVIGGTTHATEAELRQAALTGVDPHILLGQACALIEMTLGVEHCRALEITAAGRVELRASIGSNATFTDC